MLSRRRTTSAPAATTSEVVISAPPAEMSRMTAGTSARGVAARAESMTRERLNRRDSAGAFGVLTEFGVAVTRPS